MKHDLFNSGVDSFMVFPKGTFSILRKGLSLPQGVTSGIDRILELIASGGGKSTGCGKQVICLNHLVEEDESSVRNMSEVSLKFPSFSEFRLTRC